MNWKIFGVLVVGTGLLAACAASPVEPTMASPTGNRKEPMDPGPVASDEAQPVPPKEKEDAKKDIVMHE